MQKISHASIALTIVSLFIISPVHGQVLSAGILNPTHPTLELWLDASTLNMGTTSVSQWTDQSGKSGRNAIQYSGNLQPTYIACNPIFAGRPSVSFDGSDLLISASGATMAIDGAKSRTIFFVFSQDAAGDRNILGYGANANLQLFDVALPAKNIHGHFHGTPFVPIVQNPDFNVGQMTVGTVRYDGATFEVYHHNTSFSGITGSVNYSLNTQGANNLQIGAGIYPAYNSYLGDIAEILIYSEKLSEQDHQAIDDYLFQKYTTPRPPIADAGVDFSASEGQMAVMLDGSLSIDPDNHPLTYAWAQVGGTSVTLSDPAAQQPTFDAPVVAIGGETLSFELTVSACGEFDTDTVSVTVVNVNHPPVADAGDDQSVSEGAPVTLHGEDSFDIDNDSFTYAWVQVDGVAVTLAGENTASPTFTAPSVGPGGTLLVFELTVDDGFPFDVPAPGYAFEDVIDSVTVEITNVNNDPTASAGVDQTVDEQTGVSLDGSGSDDPDDDTLTYSWAQTGGTAVALAGGSTATPSFTTPFVTAGGEDLTFELTVNDGFGGNSSDSVVIHVQNSNDPPLVSAAVPSLSVLWPPNHGLVSISIDGVSDPDNNALIIIDGVTQDEPTNGQGDGDTAIDAVINGDGTVHLRAERSGNGNGRVYHIHFTALDLEGSASGVVTVSVPKKKKDIAIDGGELFDSTQ